MILTWVLSLILLCSSLIKQLESLTTQSLIELKAMTDAQEQFFSAEKAVVECLVAPSQVLLTMARDWPEDT